MAINSFFNTIKNIFFPPKKKKTIKKNVTVSFNYIRPKLLNNFFYNPIRVVPVIRKPLKPKQTPAQQVMTTMAVIEEPQQTIVETPESDIIIREMYYSQNEDRLYIGGSNLSFDKSNALYAITIKNEHQREPIRFNKDGDTNLLSAIVTSSNSENLIIDTSIQGLEFIKYDTNSGSILFSKPAMKDYEYSYSFENGVDPQIKNIINNKNNFFTINSLPATNNNISGFKDSSKNNMIAMLGTIDTADNETPDAIQDGVRYNSKRYWVFDSESTSYGEQSDIKYEILVSSSNKTDSWIMLSSENKQEQYRDQRGNYSPTMWNRFINGEMQNNQRIVDTNSQFEDLVYDFSSPYSNMELKRTNTEYKSLFYSIQQKYNFYIKSYENMLNIATIDEKLLPNMYSFISQQKTRNESFQKLITLNGAISDSFLPSSNAKGEYYEEFSNKYLLLSSSNQVSEKQRFSELTGSIANKFSNILISQKDIDIIQEYNDKKEIFPMFVEINFSTDKSTEFAQTLKDTKLNDMFLQALVNKTNDPSSEQTQTIQRSEQINIDTQTGNATRTYQSANSNKRTWILADILQEIYSGSINAEESTIFLGETQQSKTSSPEFNFFKTLMFGVLEGKLKKLIQKYERNYVDILNGKKCYNETVAYRIEKRFGGRTVQNYYLMNSSDLDVVSLIDTQVKYNTNYTYIVYAYEMVLSSRYAYSDFVTDLYKNVAFKVKTETIPVIIEQEYFRKDSVRITDSPPIRPEVEFVPYKGVDNKMLILLNSSVGKLEEQPISIHNTDNGKILQIRQQQEKLNIEPILFESDDHARSYEIYRTDIPPEKYEDFKNFMLVNKTTELNSITQQSSTSTSHVDTILPNKKYYYTVRSIDNHGNFSNPTSVFEVQIINENGTIFPIIKPYTFKEPPKTLVKNAKRFIQISPMNLQTLVNEEKSGYANRQSARDVRAVSLGNIEGSVWDKDFLIRVTSKSTGKKIDFKVKFVVKTEKEQ